MDEITSRVLNTGNYFKASFYFFKRLNYTRFIIAIIILNIYIGNKEKTVQ